MERFKNLAGKTKVMVLTPDKLAGFHRTWEAYDAAPAVAEQIFGKHDAEPEEISQVFDDAYAKTSDGFEQQAVCCAYNYTLVTSLLRRERHGAAAKIIDTIVDKDESIFFLNHLVNTTGPDYLAECISNRKFMVPSELDKSVFKRCAPESMDLVEEYYKHDALLVAAERADREYYCNVNANVSANVQLAGPGVKVAFEIVQMLKKDIIFKASEQRLRDDAKKMFSASGIDDYLIMFTKHQAIGTYLTEAFGIRSVPLAVKKLALMLPTRHHLLNGEE